MRRQRPCLPIGAQKNDFKERIAIFCPEEYKREIVFNRTLAEFQYALSNGRITYYLQP